MFDDSCMLTPWQPLFWGLEQDVQLQAFCDGAACHQLWDFQTFMRLLDVLWFLPYQDKAIIQAILTDKQSVHFDGARLHFEIVSDEP